MVTSYPNAERKRVTAADVARSLGISRATVGFVLNDTPGQTISPAMREKVLAEARRLGYRPHTAARALARGRSSIVLLVLPDWPMDFSMRSHLEEASLALDEAGYSLVTMTPHEGGQARPLWETLSPDVVVSLAPLADEQYEAIRDSGAQTIIAGRDNVAGFDDEAYAIGPRLQVEHLLETGRTRLAFAAPADTRLDDLGAARYALASATAANASRDLGPMSRVDEASADDALARWRHDGVDGVVAYNDDVAALVLRAALLAGVAVPDELAIVGHDDTPLARLLVPGLSSVRVDTAGLGRFLAHASLSTLGEAPASGALPPTPTVELVRRATT